MREHYRVEDAEGRGPFRPGLARYWVDEDIGERWQLLTPWQLEVEPRDVIAQLRPGERVGCACETMQDLREWFTAPELDRLTRIGYRVVTFTPRRVLYRLAKQSIVVLPDRGAAAQESA